MSKANRLNVSSLKGPPKKMFTLAIILGPINLLQIDHCVHSIIVVKGLVAIETSYFSFSSQLLGLKMIANFQWNVHCSSKFNRVPLNIK